MRADVRVRHARWGVDQVRRQPPRLRGGFPRSSVTRISQTWSRALQEKFAVDATRSTSQPHLLSTLQILSLLGKAEGTSLLEQCPHCRPFICSGAPRMELHCSQMLLLTVRSSSRQQDLSLVREGCVDGQDVMAHRLRPNRKILSEFPTTLEVGLLTHDWYFRTCAVVSGFTLKAARYPSHPGVLLYIGLLESITFTTVHVNCNMLFVVM